MIKELPEDQRYFRFSLGLFSSVIIKQKISLSLSKKNVKEIRGFYLLFLPTYINFRIIWIHFPL